MGYSGKRNLDKKISRILLIYPPIVNIDFTNNVCELPLGLASIAAFVRDQVEVQVLDAALEGYHHEETVGPHLIRYGLSDAVILKKVAEVKPDLVGFSCLFSGQFPIIRGLVEQVKKLDPGMVTVVGGTHPSMLPETALKTTKLDFVILGEGELSFSRLLDRLSKGQSVADLGGIALRDNGGIRVNKEVDYIEDLNTLPIPARELFKVEEYFKINLPMQTLSRSARTLAVASSRGCPYNCGFCCSVIHWGHRFRARSPEHFLGELEQLKSRWDVKELKFQDDNLTFNHKHAKEVFSGMIDRKLDLVWNTPNGISPWTLNEEILELMKASGCYEIALAIESGDPWVLKNLIHKPVDLEQTRQVVKIMKKVGIETSAFFIIGFPTETRQQIMNTINYAKSLDLDRCYLLIYAPLPGTPLAQLAIERGKISSDFDFENANNYFLPKLHLSEVEPEELIRVHRRAFWEINLAFLYRHPAKFFEKYYRTLASHPEFILKFLKALFR